MRDACYGARWGNTGNPKRYSRPAAIASQTIGSSITSESTRSGKRQIERTIRRRLNRRRRFFEVRFIRHGVKETLERVRPHSERNAVRPLLKRVHRTLKVAPHPPHAITSYTASQNEQRRRFPGSTAPHVGQRVMRFSGFTAAQ